MIKLLLLTLLALAVKGQQFCGAPQCYFPCTDARPQVDIVFLLDVSGSMDPYILSVCNGITTFVDNLSTDINPSFTVVLFGDTNNGGLSKVSFALSTNAASFKTYMYNRGRTTCSGGVEAGLETLNQAMNKAIEGNLNIPFRSSQNAKKVFIVVTNEDADLAVKNANLFASQTRTVLNDKYCYNLQSALPSGWKAITAAQWPSWQAEVNNVANNLITLDANFYAFVAGRASLLASGGPPFYSTCNTIYQYCNPDLQTQNTDYTNFDGPNTLSRLTANSSHNSVQGILLANKKTARCFEVQDLKGSNAPTLVNNFFSQVTADLTKCNTLCFNYTCKDANTCNPPIAKCDCFGVPFTSGGNGVLDKNGVCCPGNKIDYNNVCCTGSLDPCGVCTSGGVSSTCKQDCAGTWYLNNLVSPPHHLDECGNCVANGVARAATCIQDCAGTWYTSTNTPPHFKDNCGYCVNAGTNADAHKDSCGVCDGGNQAKGPCNNCFESWSKDACGQYVCKNLTCGTDCDGENRNPLIKHVDECGNCILKTVERSPFCVLDCLGVYYNQSKTAPHHYDECNNCILFNITRLPSCVQDCSGAWGGTAYRDNCTQCIVNNVIPTPCVKDCAGVYYLQTQTPPHTVDLCGICNTPANQNSLFDNCSVCTNSPNYDAAQCTPDCKGVYRLLDDPQRAFTDGCGDCWFYNQRDKYNYLMDDCGFCFPSRTSPGWNQHNNGKDSQGGICKCLTLPIPCPGGNATTCTDYCPPACVVNGTSVAYDNCGRCPGDMYYNQPLDDCGVCSTANHTWNADKDSCGVCFGGDALKLTNPCHLCNASACVVDCEGTPMGTKVYDCAGVCGGTTLVCSVCGDGIQTGTEECDLGADNGKEGAGCTSTCHAVAAQNVGAIAGGIVGALVGLVVLGLAAFLALQYAKKNGLIGNANKQLDMAASNSNPLYKSEVNVQHNPLYGQS